MDIRMLPIRHVFERFPRLVRDLAHRGEKQVELVLQGEDTRVDKAVIDEIGELPPHALVAAAVLTGTVDQHEVQPGWLERLPFADVERGAIRLREHRRHSPASYPSRGMLRRAWLLVARPRGT